MHGIDIDLIVNTPEKRKEFREEIMDSPVFCFHEMCIRDRCTTYICIDPAGFGLGPHYALGIALIAVVLAAIWFNIWYFKTTKKLW